MKKKLMKMALCALALLPMGAWADGIDFGTEVTVSTETLWIFDNATNFPADMDINSISVIKDSEGTESAYIRAWNTRHAKIADADGVADFKKYDGTTVSITKGLTLTKAADVSKLTPITSAGVSSETCTANGLFGINAEVPGTIYAYVKGKANDKLRLYHTCYPNSGGTALSEKEIVANGDPQVMALTSTGKGTFFVSDPTSDHFVIYAILFVPTTSTGISDVTTWTFENYQPISFFNGNVTDLSNGLFARCYSENTGTLKVASQDDLTSWTFADGWRVSNLSQCFTLGKLANATGNVDPGVSNNTMEGSLAFKVTTDGKVYVVASSDAASGYLRIYNFDESTTTQKLNKAITATPDEYSVDVVAGTVYICHQTAGAKVYAVRFVPKDDANSKSWVYVGATGYATFANNKELDVPTLPEGLSAYAATAGADGHTVNLSTRTGLRQLNAYIVQGTPGTIYELTHSGTALKSAYNGGSMKRAATYASTNIPATDGANYNYILAAEGGVAKFFAPDGASKLHSTKAFLQVNTELTPATGDSKGFEIIFGKSEDSETTAIEGIAPVSAENGKYYNLMGVEVAHPTKGVYIVNGKKVVVK